MRAIRELRQKFGGAAATIAAGTLALSPMAAFAGDNAPDNGADSFWSTHCDTPAGYPELACATEGFGTPMSLTEINAIPSLYKDRVILHFGNGILDAGLAALASTKNGTPTIAIPGGPDGLIRLIVDGRTNEKFRFTQSNLDRGEVTSLGARVFRQIQDAKSKTASLTPASISE